MSRRLHQTLADYVVIAISPALIIALVGSLMFFLLRVFYQGEFQERLHWVMACFVFAAVLIGRISIEEGFERAAPFGAALAILVGIAANRFMEYQGTWVDDFGWIVNFAVIGLVWWCAHQLTWDCTVIDDAEDSSGEGLMQVVGLEKPADDRNAVADEERLAGTTSRQVPTGFWQRYVEHQRRPHAPGVWVVYFSLAALPIFGLGQWLIPVSDAGGRRYVFWLLCIYVASGLGLLLTTSFLGLRRYLRQRRIEMPTLMSNLWLSTGAAIIALLLVAAALLPRPSAEFAVSQLPFKLGSPEQESSDVAPVHRDGTRDDEPGPAAEKEPGEAQPGENPPEGSGNQPGGKSGDQGSGNSEQQGSGEQGKSNGEASGQKSTQQGEGQQQNSPSEETSPDERSNQTGEDANQRRDQSSQSAEEDDNPEHRESQQELTVPNEDESANEQSNQPLVEQEEESTAAGNSAPAPPTTPDMAPALSPLMTIVKYVFYAIFILGVLFALWRYHAEILRAIQNFIQELRTWWQSLWGGKRDYGVAEDAVLDIRVPAAPFASFTDPFVSGVASGQSPEQLVRYSFEAFEAWSREHGCERALDQTPHEYARDVARLNAFIASDARNLAELYARAAFARGRLPADSGEQLQKLWEKMNRRAGVAT